MDHRLLITLVCFVILESALAESVCGEKDFKKLFPRTQCPAKWFKVQPVYPSTSIVSEINKKLDDEMKQDLQDIKSFFIELQERAKMVSEITNYPRSCDEGSAGGNSVIHIFRFNGFGNVTKNCRRTIYFSKTNSEGRNEKSKKLFNAMHRIATEAVMAGKKIIKDTNLNWDKEVHSNLIYPDDPFENLNACNVTLVRGTGIRVDGKWNMVLGFTSHPAKQALDEDERYSYSEIVQLDGDMIRTYPVNLIRCDSNCTRLEPLEAPATIFVGKGVSSYSSFIKLKFADNPAVIGTSIGGKDVLEEFEDVDTPSDVAIFLLPVILAIVPISLFQDIGGQLGLLFYIFTDLISAIPIGLKAGELLRSSQSSNYLSGGYVFGGDDLSQPGAVEFWVARCVMERDFQRKGKWLLAVAVVAMVLAVSLDLVVTRLLFLRKKKFKAALDRFDSSGRHKVGLSGHGLLWYLHKKNWPPSVTEISPQYNTS